ncbi:MAG: sulfur carrier protein ThiS [Firmicutes bacterium]|nr:sulfur carrier protein ThiS [Bacillota bacterium]
MDLVLNGELRTTPEFQTLDQLASWLELPSFGCAIELNGEVIRKRDYPQTPLAPGDRLEIVKLVGGG